MYSDSRACSTVKSQNNHAAPRVPIHDTAQSAIEPRGEEVPWKRYGVEMTTMKMAEMYASLGNKNVVILGALI